jgi:hypothetical protein
MQVRLPFAYSHEYFNVGGKKISTRNLYDWIEADIREVSAREAPLAARWQECDHGTDRWRGIEVRYNAGHFYRPDAYEGGDWMSRGDTVMSADKLVDPNGPAAVIQFMANCGGSNAAIVNAFQGKPNSKPPKPSGVEFDLGDNEIEARRNAETYLEGILVIDGRVWRRCHEPVLVNHADDPLIAWPEIHRRIVTIEPTFDSFGAPPHFSAHRIDRVDRWEGYREPDGRERLKVKSRALQILIPDAFSFDEERNAMRRSVEAFLELVGQDAWRWDRERVARFVDVRDRFQTYLAGNGAALIEDILEEASDFMEGVRPLHERYRIPVIALKYAATLEPTIELEIGRFPA